MAENSNIEWTDHTFNPWIGCQKVSPACDHCYAETFTARFGQVEWGPGKPRKRTSAANWRKPLKWNRDAAAFAEKHGRRQRVFCASLADVFDNAVDPQWRADLFDLIDATPDLDWLLLTKRIGNVAGMTPHLDELPNVWLGATICNQEEANRDIPKLLDTEARVRFLSMEPLLGPVDLTTIWLRRNGQRPTKLSHKLGDYVQPLRGNFIGSPILHWIIAGGESGPGARPMHPDWARSLRDQCEAAGVPFLFKQWGEWGCLHQSEIGDEGRFVESQPGGDVTPMVRVGKKRAGRLLDGRECNGFPDA